MGRRPLIGVMGAAEGADPEALRLAEQLGEAIARRGWALLSGGRPSGVMAAACRAGEDVVANRRHAEAWLERALQPPAGTRGCGC